MASTPVINDDQLTQELLKRQQMQQQQLNAGAANYILAADGTTKLRPIITIMADGKYNIDWEVIA